MAPVVFLKAIEQILGETGVMLVRINFTDKNIDVGKSWLFLEGNFHHALFQFSLACQAVAWSDPEVKLTLTRPAFVSLRRGRPSPTLSPQRRSGA